MSKGKSIDDYRAKRDFERTPEPPPTARDGRDGAPVFVVHRHDATRLHYDLRLEMEGVLRSWAIPKGFSYDPADKHLAVRTEDHPLEYEDFHGVIPKGEYGAGTMTIWDRGRYEIVKADSAPEAVQSGEVKVILRGRRLRGEWHLVKTKQAENHWLLFKSKDSYSGAARDSSLGIDLTHAEAREMPRRLERMDPSEECAPFSDPAWLFEAAFEGKRVFAEKRGDEVRIRGLRQSLPHIEDALRRLHCENALLEGVLTRADDNERPSRVLLDASLQSGDTEKLVLYAFELLYYDEFDLRSLPQVDRKGALRSVLPDNDALLFVDHVPGNGEELAGAMSSAGLPEMIAKRADASYSSGASTDWRRVHVDAKATGQPISQALGGSRAAHGTKRVRYTNLEKVYWPGDGFTKGDLIGWYERVADLLLPYLEGRPIHMNRFPDGIEGQSFYQRKAKEETPDWVETVMVDSESHGEEVEHMICSERDTLLYLANLGSIDLHPWLSRTPNLESPTWGIIDLDPKTAPFRHVIEIARRTGEVLREIGVRPLLKTSGKTGLHIYIPLIDGYTYEHARMFCEGVSRLVARELSDIATVERVIGSREGKVYVDFGQNRRGQTVVPPYSVRPVRGATVSMPLEWDELEDDLTPARFTILTAVPRIEERGDLFRPALDDRQDLLPAIEALQSRLSR